MVNIIQLNNDPHAQTQALLPWHLNGTLVGAEAAQIEAHLSECAECRADLEMERALGLQLKALLGDADRGWATLRARIDKVRSPSPQATLFGRAIPLRWVWAAQAASLALLISLLALGLAQPHAPYRTLGSAPSAAASNLIVMFKPESSESSFRAVLAQNQARIVDGPTSAGAYVLHVAPDQRQQVLARLKADRNISLAEPIDGDDR